MGHGHVNQLRDKVSRRRLADEQPHLLKGVGHPGEEDEQRNADGANGIQVPHEAVSHDRHDQTEAIDHNVIAVVDLRGVPIISTKTVI